MNKRFTDIFIKRPVLATVVSLFIFLFGTRAIHNLNSGLYPHTNNTKITVTTIYPGASAQLIQGFITTPIEKAIASADGIDYMTASSTNGISSITVYVKLNYDPNKAFTDVMSKVSEVRNQLPSAAEEPTIEKSTGNQMPVMFLSFLSNKMLPQQISDYLDRVVVPQFSTVQGVAQARIMGNIFAMRVWLNRNKMAALNITPAQVIQTLTANNFIAAAGTTKGKYIEINVNAQTDLHDVKGFENMVVKTGPNALVRLKDIAKVELGAENYDVSIRFNKKPAVFLAISPTPSANILAIAKQIHKLLPKIQKTLPAAMQMKLVYDESTYINAAIGEVKQTIVEAAIIVIFVIFLFLGSFRTTLIPIVTIPLSLVGVCGIMLALNFTINFLTLLAMVLAIGLVVDDAIVVVENIYRHIEAGMKPLEASLQGAREIAFPVISMTITLMAVYAPIGFMGGLTGSLFKEFAFTLACTVLLSGIIALTLAPMMASKFLNSNLLKNRYVHFVDHRFEQFKQFYKYRLTSVLKYRPAVLIVAATVLASCFFLYMGTPSELAPHEDQGFLITTASSPQSANLNFIEHFSGQYQGIYQTFPQIKDSFEVNGWPDSKDVFSLAILKPWNQRDVSDAQIQPKLQAKLSQLTGIDSHVSPPPALPSSGGFFPVDFVLNTIGNYQGLYQASKKIQRAAEKSGLFLFITNSLKFNNPELNITINRDKAAEYGVSMQNIAATLAGTLAGYSVNRFSINSRSYKVIPQLQQTFRLNPNDLNKIYISTAKGEQIPLSSVIHISQTVQPNSLTQFQQLNSLDLEGVMAPGITLGQGLNFLKTEANKTLPHNIFYDYAGQSRQFIKEGGALLYTFFFAIIIIFLVLAAQFESFRDPFIILISVPMSICGALIPLNLGLASINIYTQIGLVTLIGLISKHGILMVDFANQLQATEGKSKLEAIIEAASIRLRPILMTTAAMILGVAPLLFAHGAGAHSRFDIGIVISFGMFIGTIFTLFVVPTMYTFLARTHHKID